MYVCMYYMYVCMYVEREVSEWSGFVVLLWFIWLSSEKSTPKFQGEISYGDNEGNFLKAHTHTNSVQFSSVPESTVSCRGHEGGFSTDPLQVFFGGRPLRAVLAKAEMSTLWCCPSSISSADHGLVQSPRCLKGWSEEAVVARGMPQAMRVSVSWQLPEEVREGRQGSWPSSASSRWSKKISCALYQSARAFSWLVSPQQNIQWHGYNTRLVSLKQNG